MCLGYLWLANDEDLKALLFKILIFITNKISIYRRIMKSNLHPFKKTVKMAEFVKDALQAEDPS